MLLLLCGVALGITPSGELSIRQSTTVVYVAPGGFGDDLPDESDTIYRKLVRPLGDADGCSPEIPLLFPKNSQFYLLVQRGNCTFAEKAQAALEKAGIQTRDLQDIASGIRVNLDPKKAKQAEAILREMVEKIPGYVAGSVQSSAQSVRVVVCA